MCVVCLQRDLHVERLYCTRTFCVLQLTGKYWLLLSNAVLTTKSLAKPVVRFDPHTGNGLTQISGRKLYFILFMQKQFMQRVLTQLNCLGRLYETLCGDGQKNNGEAVMHII